MLERLFFMKFWISLFLVVFSFHTVIGRNNEIAHPITSFCPPTKSSSTEITCIQTNTNGDVTLFWTQAANTSNSFVEYQVHSIQNGLITTINSIGTTLYTQTGVNQKLDYFITAVYGTGGNETSQTISNIFLSLNNPSDGTAVLQWNNPTTGKLPGMESYTKIYREYPTGTWTLRDSVPYGAVFFKDTIDICQAFLNYKVVVKSLPCDFTSNILGDNFKDITSPDIPKIINVTIDTLNSSVLINWNKNNQSDTQGYIVYSIDGSGNPTEIATVNGVLNTNFNFSTNITSGPLTYSIAAFDYCLTTSSIPTFQTSAKADVHTSMYVRYGYNICSRNVRLTWTPYKGWNNISRYEIWGHILGEPWEKFGSTNTFEYNYTGKPLKDYCFVIRAISPDSIESFSNSACLNTISPSQPAYNYLKTATVKNNKIELHHYIEKITGVKEIVFQRLNNKKEFEEIGRIQPTSENVLFIDSTINPNRQSYTYRVVVIDSCDNEGSISNVAKTIFLSVKTENTEMIHYLNWSEYIGFKGSLLGYSIYEGIDGILNTTPISTVPSNEMYYQDNISTTNYSGKICYYVEAIEGDNMYGFKDTSRSNSVCPIIKPIIYLPNSFTPNNDKINDVFYPKVSLIENASYTFTIFDRWEHILFESNKIEDGWNGEINNTGKIAQPGTYVYILNVKDGNGIETIQRGHVNVLK